MVVIRAIHFTGTCPLPKVAARLIWIKTSGSTAAPDTIMFKYFPTNYVWNLSVNLAIEMGADAVDIGKTIHPHPTLGESIGMAAEVAHGSCTDVPPARK